MPNPDGTPTAAEIAAEEAANSNSVLAGDGGTSGGIEEGAGTAGTASFETPESSVQGQLASLLSKDNDLFKLAGSRAKEEANKLGLLSSSLAVGAGQKAVLDQALPIAQQDAATSRDFGLVQAKGAEDIKLAEKSGEIEGGLQAEAATQALTLEDKQAQNRLTLETFAQDQQNLRLTEELTSKLNIAEQQMSAENQQIFTESTGKMFQQYQDLFTKIQTTADDILDAGEKSTLIKDAQAQLQNQVDLLGSLLGFELSWE